MPEITNVPTEEKEGERRIDLSEIIGLPDFDVGRPLYSHHPLHALGTVVCLGLDLPRFREIGLMVPSDRILSQADQVGGCETESHVKGLGIYEIRRDRRVQYVP